MSETPTSPLRQRMIEDERLDFEFLFDDTYSVAVGTRHPLARRRKISLGELMDAAWALPPPESTLGMIATKAFRGLGLDLPRPIVPSDSAGVAEPGHSQCGPCGLMRRDNR